MSHRFAPLALVLLLCACLLPLSPAAPALAADEDGPEAAARAFTALDPVFLNWPQTLEVSGEQPVRFFFQTDSKECRKLYGNDWWRPCGRDLGLAGQAAQDVALNPPLEGKWRWLGDKELEFTPAKPWIPGQRYSLSLGPRTFPSFVKPGHLAAWLNTRPFKPEIKSLRFFHDPGDASRKVLSATLTFNYRVLPEAVAARLRFVVDTQRGRPAPVALSAPEVVWNQERTEATVSATVKDLPDQKTRVRLVLAPGLTAAVGGPPAPEVWQQAEIPGRADFLRLLSADTGTVVNERMEAAQCLNLAFTFKVPLAGVRDHLRLGLLPRQKNQAAADKQPYDWKKLAELTPEILDRTEPLDFAPAPGQDEAAPRASFRFKAEPGRTILVRLTGNLTTPGGYVLSRDSVALVKAPGLAPEVRLMQGGAILPLTGEKKLTLQGRGLSAIAWEASRVRPEFVSHLLTQGQGDFQDFDLPGEVRSFPDGEEFRPSGLGFDDVSEVLRGEIPLALTDDRLPQFTALDLAPLLGQGRKGLFRFSLQGRRGNATLDSQDRRFVLVTDLALVMKNNADRSREVFVASLSGSGPAPGARVSVLGRNGLSVFTAEAGPDGRVSLPDLTGLKREKEPVAISATLGEDLAFLGWNRADRRVDYSRFDVGGLVSSPGGINAFVFSQRGMYRPGDALHFGFIVKSTDWKPLAGLPLAASLRDPRGRTVREWNLTLAPDGFGELSQTLAESAATGRYHLDIRLAKSREGEVLGSASVMVHEFLPDTMAIKAALTPDAPRGWVRATSLTAEAALSRLYGTPAAAHRVKASLTLEPAVFRFPQYRDYTFHDAAPAQGPPVSASLGEAVTGDDGRVRFPVDLAGYRRASSALVVDLEGLDAASGRSVSTQARVLVSPLPFLLGWRTDANLAYLRQGRPASVEFLAVDPQLARADTPLLTFDLGRVEHVSTLVFDQSQRKYRYEATPRVKPLSQANRTVPAEGASVALPVADPGDYLLEVRDASGLTLSRLPFTVAGEAPAALGQDKEGSLRVRLDREEYEPGGAIEVSIAAPFGGAGLITIERDRVAAHAWFTAPAGETVQKITLPRDFEGKGYVNVSLFRGLDSKEIFIKPHCYAVVPFTAGVRARDLGVKIAAPDVVRPGSRVEVNVSASRPGRVLVFAVDEGILALTRYKTPAPVDHFLKNRALEVITAQYLDLLMPEHSRVMAALSAFGGDAIDPSALRQNPFKRKSEPPAVWWAGMAEVSPTPRTLTLNLPPYYNGRLRIMAVAVAGDGLSASERPLTVKGDLILTPFLPLAVSPGDEFVAGVAVGNHRAGSGKAVPVKLAVDPGPSLEVVGAAPPALTIDEGREAVALVRLKARDSLGETAVTFRATLGNFTAERPVSLSLRPASPRRTTLAVGQTQGASDEVPVGRELYPQFATVEASASLLPLPLLQALSGYLAEYPHGCTEQVVSRAFPALLAARRPDLMAPPGGNTPEFRSTAEGHVAAAVATLADRRVEDQGFAMWPQGAVALDFPTVYAADFLLEAAEAGFSLPAGLLDDALKAVRNLALRAPRTQEDARLRGYAAWLLTRSGQITADILAVQMGAMDKAVPGWREDVTALMLASCAKLMLQGRLAGDLASGYNPAPAQAWRTTGFVNGLAAQALALSALSRHFPERLGSEAARAALGRMTAMAAAREYSTLSSALSCRAVADSIQALESRPEPVTITALDAAGQPKARSRQEGQAPHLAGDAATAAFRFEGPAGLFWRVSASGFDRVLPAEPQMHGLEITREYLGAAGQPVAAAALGEELTVVLRARSHGQEVANVAITDLIPGGFDLVLKPRPGTTTIPANTAELVPDWVDRREDRVLVFATLTPREQAFVYRIKAVARGRFAAPPPAAEAMYDPALEALGAGGTMEVK